MGVWAVANLKPIHKAWSTKEDPGGQYADSETRKIMETYEDEDLYKAALKKQLEQSGEVLTPGQAETTSSPTDTVIGGKRKSEPEEEFILTKESKQKKVLFLLGHSI